MLRNKTWHDHVVVPELHSMQSRSNGSQPAKADQVCANPVRVTQLFENVRAEATHRTYETRTRALHQACRAEWETRATHRTAGNRPPFEGFNKECVGVHANLGYPGARVHGQFRSLCHRPLDPCYLGPLDPWILGHLVAFDQERAYMLMPWWNFQNQMNISQVHMTWWIFQNQMIMFRSI